MEWIDTAEVTARVPMIDAVDSIEAALLAGLDPAAGPGRNRVEVEQGQFLLMPAEHGPYAGVKVATVAPDNPARGLPRIHAVYLLMDGDTLAPLATIEGTALTSLRTPAVSAVAMRRLAAPEAAELVVFGSGPQAWGHIEAARAVRPIEHVTVVARNALTGGELVRRCTDSGIAADLGAPEAVRTADIVACCTSAGEPLFDGTLPPEHAVITAVGSHEPELREVDDTLVRRSTVVVEDTATALREAGDVVLALESGALAKTELLELAELVREHQTPPAGPRLFKGTGMAWQDLAVAATVYQRHTAC